MDTLIIEVFHDNRHRLQPGVPFSAEDFFGRELWDRFDGEEQRYIGLRVKALIRKGLLPIRPREVCVRRCRLYLLI